MRGWKIPLSTSIIGLIVFILIFNINGLNEEANRINIRLSARFSGVLFSLAFVASSYQYFFKGQFSFWLLANRKFIGISFAIMHLLHLLLLFILQYSFHPVFTVAKTSSLIGGGMAYGFAFLMFATSFQSLKSRMSNKAWGLLHSVGGYWIWFIFIKSYWKRMTTELEYLPLVTLFSLVLIFRLAKVIAQYRFRTRMVSK